MTGIGFLHSIHCEGTNCVDAELVACAGAMIFLMEGDRHMANLPNPFSCFRKDSRGCSCRPRNPLRKEQTSRRSRPGLGIATSRRCALRAMSPVLMIKTRRQSKSSAHTALSLSCDLDVGVFVSIGPDSVHIGTLRTSAATTHCRGYWNTRWAPRRRFRVKLSCCLSVLARCGRPQLLHSRGVR